MHPHTIRKKKDIDIDKCVYDNWTFKLCCKQLQMLLVLFQVKNVKLDCKISAKVSTVSKKVDHIVQSYLKLFHSYLFQTSEIVILEDSFSSSIFMVHENQKVCFIDFFSFICFHLHVILNFVFFLIEILYTYHIHVPFMNCFGVSFACYSQI